MITTNTDFYYDHDRDCGNISDYERKCSAVQDYYHVQDSEGLAAWRAKWFSECRICGRYMHCFACLQMQSAKPEMML